MIYICVLNYNNAQDTIVCLESLKKLNNIKYKVILVDNGSPDDSVDILKKYKNDNVHCIFSKKNLGYAAGNNLAIRYAMNQDNMEYCWIINNDTVVHEDSLYYLKKYMDANPGVGLCGSKLVYEWDRTRLQGYGGIYNPYLGITRMCTSTKDIKKINFVCGAACLVSRAFLEEVGLMTEDYFLYYEEIDWACRAKGKFSLGCVPESIVYHKEGATIGGGAQNVNDKSELSDYYSIRNRILITKRYYTKFLPIVYLGLLITIINRIRRKQYSRIFMILKLMCGWRDNTYEK